MYYYHQEESMLIYFHRMLTSIVGSKAVGWTLWLACCRSDMSKACSSNEKAKTSSFTAPSLPTPADDVSKHCLWWRSWGPTTNFRCPGIPGGWSPNHQPHPCHPPWSAVSIRISSVPSWGQVKRSTSEAAQILVNQGKASTPKNHFLATLTELALRVFCFVPSALAQDTYWAYVLEPPLFHPAMWDSEEIKLVTNDSSLMGGEASSSYTLT